MIDWDFLACQVEDRLALEEEEQSSDPMTEQLVLLDHNPTAAATSSSGPALDFFTLTKQRTQETESDGDQDDDDDDIERLMALLGLSPPQDVHGGCDCSGADGFLAKVVGVVGPKCEREKTRLHAWIHHFYSSQGSCREPARLAHLLLGAKFSDEFPATVKEFLNRDVPSTD